MGNRLAGARKKRSELDRARSGHAGAGEHHDLGGTDVRGRADLGFRVGAGEGNRTLMTSLEDR